MSYTRARQVWVTHSTDTTRTLWTEGFLPNVPDAVIDKDDISALVTFGDSIGLLWSDQESDVVRFAVRHVGASDIDPWQVEDALAGTSVADDHIYLARSAGDPLGRIFAAVKTAAEEGADEDAALVGVLVRTPGANGAPARWTFTSAGTVAQGWTRPILMIDDTNKQLYIFVTSSSRPAGGNILYRRTDLPSDPAHGLTFTAARSFLADVRPLHNVTGAKAPVTGETGLVVLATSHPTKSYAHAEMALVPGGTFDEGGADITLPTFGGTNSAVDATGVVVGGRVTATFLIAGSLLLFLLLVPLVRHLRR
ncbi:hypothetical protein [Blastococcus brunescens]|uniref:Uncharacterized protein n=1 Tax=Blastococcus brunescens TaxID=1564165 RepID=A0ABZ1B0L0_9ACTN|nr:hypothetical protein [Blastococcus sp. BMG 8361]WRL64348.1 hypothetical protein U6N30_00300 [Blastococcus sp. BMG 8361]